MVMPAITPIADPGQRPSRILVVDDEPSNLDVLTRLLGKSDYELLIAHDGQSAVDIVRREHPDLVLMDVMMPVLSGFEACRAIKADPTTRLIPVVLVTSLQDPASRIEGIEAGADDFLSKPYNRQEMSARVKSLLRIKKYTDELDSAEALIMSLASTIEARDPLLNGHCQRLARYATILGQALSLGPDQLDALEVGGYLHDLGKIAVPDAILLKQGPLTKDEFEVMKTHVIVGEKLCGDLRAFRRVRPIVRHHHERLDGSGYPDGLVGDDIPLLAQIIGLVDVYDALTTTRPYRAALTAERAIDELRAEVRRGWRRADLVDAFVLTTVEA
jgi:putative two-component system response regulator